MKIKTTEWEAERQFCLCFRRLWSDENQIDGKITGSFVGLSFAFVSDSDNDLVSKEHNHGILIYFDHRQNYREIEGKLKIILYKDIQTQKK